MSFQYKHFLFQFLFVGIYTLSQFYHVFCFYLFVFGSHFLSFFSIVIHENVCERLFCQTNISMKTTTILFDALKDKKNKGNVEKNIIQNAHVHHFHQIDSLVNQKTLFAICTSYSATFIQCQNFLFSSIIRKLNNLNTFSEPQRSLSSCGSGVLVRSFWKSLLMAALFRLKWSTGKKEKKLTFRYIHCDPKLVWTHTPT